MSTAVLNPIVHARLMADMAAICARANVPTTAMHKSARETLDENEMAWLSSLTISPSGVKGTGAIFVGDPDSEDKLIAIAAALLRNHLDARIMSVNTVLDQSEPSSVVLIPNLYVRGQGQALPTWKVQQLYDILLSRRTLGLLTIAYVEDMGGLKKDYGTVFERHLKNNYTILGA